MDEISTQLTSSGPPENITEFFERLSAHTRHALCLTPDFTFPYTPANDILGGAIMQVSLGNNPFTEGPLSGGPSPPEASVRFKYSDHLVQSKSAAQIIARWMGGVAQNSGLPPELPVMAALVESGLRNLWDGDRDSVGYFQIRVGIHGQAAVETPDAQLRWFVYNAHRAPLSRKGRSEKWTVDFFQQMIQIARLANNEEEVAHWLGAWCQDIERSAYPDRYQAQYLQARKLLYS
jgi:hypothetical protein